MGSLDGHAKGQQPMLDRIKAHNAAYHDACTKQAREAPLLLKVMAACGWRRPFDEWCMRTYGRYHE